MSKRFVPLLLAIVIVVSMVHAQVFATETDEQDGVKKAVYVQSYELEERENWSEDDYATAYRMMDTINHVIETIMQSKQFSATAE